MRLDAERDRIGRELCRERRLGQRCEPRRLDADGRRQMDDGRLATRDLAQPKDEVRPIAEVGALDRLQDDVRLIEREEASRRRVEWSVLATGHGVRQERHGPLRAVMDERHRVQALAAPDAHVEA